ncbi:hypothetical protein [Allostreptomyces psammosilenae]|uniref:Uncharacterized protein n=1 Tax=Allostreptomyces psammosilenae TaxID=1892865 RepID=A0A853A0U6_9ACTN|nr:hypothetical protein [Allostreptomyces psammosilenae]NYI07767.1 hypothetical protein [Allostreptomyces psammosilenae]
MGAERGDDRAGRSGPEEREARERDHRLRRAAFVFEDPFDGQTRDDTDAGWGERAGGGEDGASDLDRFLREKPPHHL